MRQKVPKERGDSLVRFITAVLFLAVLCYGAVNVYYSYENPFRTTLAVPVSLAETAPARGYVVREETVISGGSGFSVRELPDGERAAKNAIVAVVYGDGADSEAIGEMYELKTRIERIGEAATITAEERGRRSEQAVADLALLLSRRELADSVERVIEAESLIMSAPDTEQVQYEISGLQAQLDSLMRRIPKSYELRAPEAGIFDMDTDGFEGVHPDDLEGLMPSDLDALFAAPGGSGAGRIVTSGRWYLAMIVSDADAAKLVDMSMVTVRITAPVQATYEMTVGAIGRSDGTSRVVALSCDMGLTPVLDLRAVTAELVFGNEAGLRVPKAAIRLEAVSEENPKQETYVYITEGYHAKRVRVTILEEFGDSYIVEGEVIGDVKQGAMSRLRVGSEVIVRANDLYDGKIVR